LEDPLATPVNPTGLGLTATPISSVIGPNAAPAGAGEQLCKDTFLKLLVAQLKFQNPMSPSDGTQFLSQTAQFTQVEKLDDLSQQLAQLVSTDQVLGATSMLGRTVTWTGPDGTDQTGVVTGTHLGTTGAVLRISSPGGGDQDVPMSSVKAVETTPTN
jgi:flagellar basal-body rod modification protein FlgD